MKRVLLDVDGVLANFVSAYLDLVHRVTGRRHSPEHVTGFDIAQSLALSRDEAAVVNRTLSLTPGFCDSLEPYPGAIEGLRALQEVVDVWIVTSPWNSNETWTHERERWLKRHFGIPHARVIHTSAKHMVRGDFLVDDRTDTLRTWLAAGNDGAIQWETPHNRRDGWLGPSTNNWAELRERVTR